MYFFAEKIMKSFHASWISFGAPKDSGQNFRVVPAKAGYVTIILVFVVPALVLTSAWIPVGKKTQSP